MRRRSKFFNLILVHHLVLLGVHQVVPKSPSNLITSLLMSGQVSMLTPIIFNLYFEFKLDNIFPLTGPSKRKTSSFPFCSTLSLLQKNLSSSQSIRISHFTVVSAYCDWLHFLWLQYAQLQVPNPYHPHLTFRCIHHQITPHIALTVVSEGNRFILSSSLNSFILSSIIY